MFQGDWAEEGTFKLRLKKQGEALHVEVARRVLQTQEWLGNILRLEQREAWGWRPESEALPQERVPLERTWISSQRHWGASESYKWRTDVILFSAPLCGGWTEGCTSYRALFSSLPQPGSGHHHLSPH